jgi:hypothetical protein
MALARDQFGLRSMLIAVAGLALLCASATWWLRHIRTIEEQEGWLPPEAAYATLFLALGSACALFALGLVLPVCLLLAWWLSQHKRQRRDG